MLLRRVGKSQTDGLLAFKVGCSSKAVMLNMPEVLELVFHQILYFRI